MPVAVISGYYGFHNAGDEAMLYAVLEALRAAVPDLRPVVLSADPAYTSARFGVRAVDRADIRRVVPELRRADLLISGGGGLLQDVTGPKSIIYYLGVVSLARALGCPVFFYAHGVGPVNSALGRLLVRLVVGRAVGHITVRDPDSKEELVRLGVAENRVEVTADPVLGLDVSRFDRDRGRELLAGLGVDLAAPVAGVSVRPWAGQEHFLPEIAGACDELAGRGWQVVLVPMHSPQDDAACRQVAALMRGRAAVLEGPLDFADVLSLCAHLDLALGMRLHFLIFAALHGVPLVGVTYDPKVNSFLKAVGLPPGLPVEGLKRRELAGRLWETAGQRREIASALRDRVAGLRELALKNAGAAAGFLRACQK